MREQKNFLITEINTTTLTTLDYVVPSSTVANVSLVVTNNSGSINTVSIYINDGTKDYLLVSKKIASGIGKTWRVLELSDIKLNAGYTIKVQLSDINLINFNLSGTEITNN